MEKKKLILVQDGNHGEYRPRKNEFDADGIAFIRAADFCNGTLDFTGAENINGVAFQRIRKGIGKDLDTILSTKGTVGKIAFVPENSPKFVCSPQTTFWRSLDHSFLHPQYLYYALQSKHFVNQISSRKGETDMADYLSLTAQRSLSLLIPDISTQKKIVAQLSVIDAKLQLGAQTNQTLEAIAQAIFKSWFVDFDSVKAKMNGEQPEGMDAATASLFPEKLVSETGLPEGWIQSEIGDEVTVVGGGTPSKKIDDFWVDGDIHWTSPKDLSGVQDKVLLDTASKVTEAGLRKISSGLLPIDTVLLSSRAPVGYLALAKVPMAINQGYIAMKCEKQLPPEFVLQWCVHRMDEIKQRASGSTFAEISKKSFKPISVVVPTDEVLSAYQKLVKPLYDAITSNARQNEQLSTLRDTLLPKLLSGEIKLEEENNLTGALA
ncbi:restriction endonuclease subunit S [Vibrio cyclitrophicus]|uniref:restriction endonuclease subunit S n=1 Tax=Vibrio cyclitrophicus TaxID=47951 RepID=UPI00130193ED|nr:restriction endonuclease subunit S [Vibrio cyclitrophicus]